MEDRFHPGVLPWPRSSLYIRGVPFRPDARLNGVIPGEKRGAHLCACGVLGWVVLTRGYVALLDPPDVPLVAYWSWRAAPRRPAKRTRVKVMAKIAGKTAILGRYLLGNPPGLVDHRSGDELDFRRANLRVTDHHGNARNRAKRSNGRLPYKGISYDARYARRPWRAAMKLDGRNTDLGCYRSPEEAARAYDAAAVKHHGEFARLNFPDA